MKCTVKAEDKTTLYGLLIEYLHFRFRWIFVLAFVTPLSLLFDIYLRFRNWLILNAGSAVKGHQRKVVAIQRQIELRNASGTIEKMCTGRPSWQSFCLRERKYKEKMTRIGIQQLRDILMLDITKETVTVEPMVTIRQLIKFLLPLGYCLPIVPPLDDLTIGGLINGSGAGVGSHRFGLFQHICISYQLVLSDGSIVTASKIVGDDSSHHSLFFGIPWSCGTLGFLVSATLKVIPCKKHIRVSYRAYSSLSELEAKLNDQCASLKNDFVEAIQFSRNKFVTICARFVSKSDTSKGGIKSIGGYRRPWFYKHVENLATGSKEVHEYVSAIDFFRRHSRGLFWELKDVVPFANSLWFRYLFGWAWPPKFSLLKLTKSQRLKNYYSRYHIFQDFIIPLSESSSFLKLINEESGIYPLLLTPCNIPPMPGIFRQQTSEDVMYICVGIYGNCMDCHSPSRSIKSFQKFLCSNGGSLMFHGDVTLSRSEFWGMFDSSLYDYLRTKYHCREAFPDLYDKVYRDFRS